MRLQENVLRLTADAGRERVENATIAERLAHAESTVREFATRRPTICKEDWHWCELDKWCLLGSGIFASTEITRITLRFRFRGLRAHLVTGLAWSYEW